MKIQNAIKIVTATALIGFGVYDRFVDTEPVVAEEAQLLRVGEKVPDLEGRTPEGDIIKLSDLEGKVVLIDFWASWCAPCVGEMPYVVSTYNDYKDASFANGEDGFAVFSVSLDYKKSAWIGAIDRLGMEWPYQISDLKGWSSVHATKYNVNAIPAAFLIDGEGKLLYANIRAPQVPGLLNGLKD